jgi:hypothetical protein
VTGARRAARRLAAVLLGCALACAAAVPARAATDALAPPDVPPAPRGAAEPGIPSEPPRWAIQVRGGSFGLPDYFADQIFAQHPAIEGPTFGAEIRYYGEKGPRASVISFGVAFDYARCDARGTWQRDAGDKVFTDAGGDVELTAVTITEYFTLFPSWFLHPYLGVGIGVGHLDGRYEKEGDLTTADLWIPVVHVPVGLAAELGERVQVAVEGRFLDGIALNASLQLRF